MSGRWRPGREDCVGYYQPSVGRGSFDWCLGPVRLSDVRAWRAPDAGCYNWKLSHHYPFDGRDPNWRSGARLRNAFEEELDGSDNCVCDPDEPYNPCARARARKRARNKPPAHVREPKRPRNGAMPANAVIIDLTE